MPCWELKEAQFSEQNYEDMPRPVTLAVLISVAQYSMVIFWSSQPILPSSITIEILSENIKKSRELGPTKMNILVAYVDYKMTIQLSSG